MRLIPGAAKGTSAISEGREDYRCSIDKLETGCENFLSTHIVTFWISLWGNGYTCIHRCFTLVILLSGNPIAISWYPIFPVIRNSRSLCFPLFFSDAF